MHTHKLGFINDNRVKKKTKKQTRADIHGVCVLKSCMSVLLLLSDTEIHTMMN